MTIKSTIHKVDNAFPACLAAVTPMFTGGKVWSTTNSAVSVVVLGNKDAYEVVYTTIQREGEGEMDNEVKNVNHHFTSLLQLHKRD